MTIHRHNSSHMRGHWWRPLLSLCLATSTVLLLSLCQTENDTGNIDQSSELPPIQHQCNGWPVDLLTATGESLLPLKALTMNPAWKALNQGRPWEAINLSQAQPPPPHRNILLQRAWYEVGQLLKLTSAIHTKSVFTYLSARIKTHSDKGTDSKPAPLLRSLFSLTMALQGLEVLKSDPVPSYPPSQIVSQFVGDIENFKDSDSIQMAWLVRAPEWYSAIAMHNSLPHSPAPKGRVPLSAWIKSEELPAPSQWQEEFGLTGADIWLQQPGSEQPVGIYDPTTLIVLWQLSLKQSVKLSDTSKFSQFYKSLALMSLGSPEGHTLAQTILRQPTQPGNAKADIWSLMGGDWLNFQEMKAFLATVHEGKTSKHCPTGVDRNREQLKRWRIWEGDCTQSVPANSGETPSTARAGRMIALAHNYGLYSGVAQHNASKIYGVGGCEDGDTQAFFKAWYGSNRTDPRRTRWRLSELALFWIARDQMSGHFEYSPKIACELKSRWNAYSGLCDSIKRAKLWGEKEPAPPPI